MKLARALLLTVPILAAIASTSSDAAACGGCFVPVGEDTQVTGHKMLFSASPNSTTLWDQIQYSGEPSEFSWVLPIHGQVEIGLSSDVLFAQLSDMTVTTVVPPPLNCPSPPACWDWSAEDGGFGSGTGGGGGASGGVEVIAREVVGPYDTVQLKSTDPAALKDWLTTHNYNIPADIGPVIDAYVAEGFDFLAMKLVPGVGIDSMRPVRVTSQGAALNLPLRMVAAGTGAITPITLWMVGEGRYEPTNFPWFTIEQPDIVWNWDLGESNYKTLKADQFAAGNNGNWLIQHARPMSIWNLRGPIDQTIDFFPDQSGYGVPDDFYATAATEFQADIDALTNGLNENGLWLTRINAELARAALGQDLALGAASSQTEVSSFFQSTKAVGATPTCPEYPPCPDSSNGSSSGGSWWTDFGDGNLDNNGSAGGGGCAVSGESNGAGALAFIGIGLGLSIARRRRAVRSDKR